MNTSSFIAIDRTWTVRGPIEGVRNLLPDFLGKSLVSTTGERTNGHLRLRGGLKALQRSGRFTPSLLVPKTGCVDLVPSGEEETRVRVRLEAEAHPAAEDRTRAALNDVLARLHADLDALYGVVPSALRSEAPVLAAVAAGDAVLADDEGVPAVASLGAVPCR